MAPSKASLFDQSRLDVLAVIGGIAVGIWGSPHILPIIGPLVTGEAADVYGAVAGLQGSLLGFVLAALTIVLGYSQSPQLALLRRSNQLANLFTVYMAGIRAHALATLAAVLALIVNPANDTAPGLAWVVFFTSILAFLRLFRTLWATRAVVHQVSTTQDRSPGSP